ncbi:stalk domain-containing protein [Paenibacillus sp. FA6]|uniref:stalk domain-containing protein n=1 Tax=Paenibacillus sp. FA6 TaxID=3413029 RepID=UPI003F65AED1
MLHVWRKRISAVSITLMLSIILMSNVSMSTLVQAQKVEQETYRIVALGDSLTVGYQPGMDLNSIPYGFVDRLQEQGLFHGRTETLNHGILGLKGIGLEHYVEAAKLGKAITSDAIQPGLVDPRAEQLGASAVQLKSDLESADLITITIGGNDLAIIITEASTLGSNELTLKIEQLLTSYKSTMTTVIADLHELNKDALIVIADQYQPVPAVANRAMYPKLIEASNLFTGVVEKLAADSQSQGINVKVAHIAKEFEGREGTMTHIMKDRDIHPNQPGYAAMAQVFAGEIWGEHRKPTIVDKNLPMTIVVKGQELKTPYQPVLRSNQNFVAIKDIVDAVGATSVWDSASSSATITYGDRTVVITIGSSSVIVNGESIAVDSPAFLNKVGNESKTYVPLAVLATGLGFDVQYISSLRTAFINL